MGSSIRWDARRIDSRRSRVGDCAPANQVGKIDVRFRHQVRVQRGNHRMRMSELPLHEQQIAAGAQICQVTIRVPQHLYAGARPEAGLGEDPHDAPVEPRAFEGPPALVEYQRLGSIVWRDVRRQKGRAVLLNECAY